MGILLHVSGGGWWLIFIVSDWIMGPRAVPVSPKIVSGANIMCNSSFVPNAEKAMLS